MEKGKNLYSHRSYETQQVLNSKPKYLSLVVYASVIIIVSGLFFFLSQNNLSSTAIGDYYVKKSEKKKIFKTNISASRVNEISKIDRHAKIFNIDVYDRYQLLVIDSIFIQQGFIFFFTNSLENYDTRGKVSLTYSEESLLTRLMNTKNLSK